MKRVLLAALAAGALIVVPAGPTSSAPAPVPGSAGTDTSLPATDSKVTVPGRGRFSNLRVTVNQTRDLVNQAVSVTWTGGTPTETPKKFFEHYLQIFQCWGDDDGAVAENPGPPPEQCVQGASNAVPSGRPEFGFLFPEGSQTTERVVSRNNTAGFDPGQGFLEARTGQVWKPFRPVDGRPEVTTHIDPNYDVVRGGDYWLNPYFNVRTTNEVPGSRTFADGTGAELFAAATGIELPALGCGRSVQPVPGGATKPPRCWLVVVPRGSAADENIGTEPPGGVVETSLGVATSPLSRAAWRNRVAIPLEFKSVEPSCPIAADQRRIIGSELVSAAVVNWQPALCTTPGLPPYSLATVGDSGARQQLLSGTVGAPGLAVVSRPIDPATVDPQNPVVYAPLSLSGTVIGFNIERVADANIVNPAETALNGLRVAQMNLTPRLVAKLLTQSYRSQVEIQGTKPPYSWSPNNPLSMVIDPDFRQFNPEFELLGGSQPKNTGGLLLAGGVSDVAQQVWEWVLADPEAKAWLDGRPDPWGMNVNPAYATAPGVNPTGTAFGDPIPDTYPKLDEYCFQGPPIGVAKVVPPPLCGIDHLPYSTGMREAARATRNAVDGSRTEPNATPLSPDQVYKVNPPQFLGSRAILSITDSASAAQFGVQSARLSRSGDNGADRTFVAPDEPGLVAGLRAMAPKAVGTVLEPNPTAAAPGAYPLTALTYGAVAPLGLDAQARKEYAGFVDYAAGPGQVPGLKLGQLPRGYAPLPADLRAQATAAATAIRDLRAPEPEADPVPAAGEEGAAPSAGGSDGSGDPGTSGTSDTSDTDGPPGASEAPAGTPPTSSPQPAVESNPIKRIAKALLTPIERLAGSRFLLPVLAALAAVGALGALEITKRSRRSGRPDPLPAVPPDGSWAPPGSGPPPPDQPPPPPADPPRQSGHS